MEAIEASNQVLWISVVAALVSLYMFNDSFRGGVDVASAKVRNLYTRASKNWGISSFSDDELNESEKSRNIKRFRNAHVGGLYNEGNTCFMNSVIQALASCDPIVDYVETYKDDTNFSGGLRDIIENLNQIHTRQHGYATLKSMRQIGGAQRWNRYSQEDAQEFFQELLTTLEKDRTVIEKTSEKSASTDDLPEGLETDQEKAEESSSEEDKEKPSKRVTPFDGAFAVRVGCLRCGDMEGIRTGVLSSVDLNLNLDVDRVSLSQLSKDYTAMETISGVECYRCTLDQYKDELDKKVAEESVQNNSVLQSAFQKRINEVMDVLQNKVIDDKVYKQLKCTTFKVQSDKSKQTMFAQPSPDVLMIHINRSEFDLRSGIVRKNFAAVDFPVVFDLSPFTVDAKDVANNDPHYPMQGIEPENKDLYDLKAVVIHYGSANFGHYISFRKFHGLWWRISDDQVDLTTEAQVINAQGVFMLFYEKQGVSTRPQVPEVAPESIAKEESNEEEATNTSLPETASSTNLSNAVDGENQDNSI